MTGRLFEYEYKRMLKSVMPAMPEIEIEVSV
jgi:hypothetical protein